MAFVTKCFACVFVCVCAEVCVYPSVTKWGGCARVTKWGVFGFVRLCVFVYVCASVTNWAMYVCVRVSGVCVCAFLT